jgi:hypothetical protein
MRKTDIDNGLLYIVTALIACAMFLSTCSAHAQPPGPSGERLTPHLMLARMCAHEASLPFGRDDDGDGTVDRWTRQRDHDVTWGDDCFGIHLVLLRGATRYRESMPSLSESQAYVLFAIAYSHGRMLSPPAYDGNAWAMYLMPGRERPARWRGPWSAAAWHYAWNFTGGIVRLTEADYAGPTALWTCQGTITDWGGTMDSRYAQSIGHTEVQCDGDAANTWYVRAGLR